MDTNRCGPIKSEYMNDGWKDKGKEWRWNCSDQRYVVAQIRNRNGTETWKTRLALNFFFWGSSHSRRGEVYKKKEREVVEWQKTKEHRKFPEYSRQAELREKHASSEHCSNCFRAALNVFKCLEPHYRFKYLLMSLNRSTNSAFLTLCAVMGLWKRMGQTVFTETNSFVACIRPSLIHGSRLSGAHV